MEKQSPQPTQPQEGPLNLLGWALVIATAVFTLGVALPVTWWITDWLRWPIYPVIMLAIPTIVFGFAFWVGCFKICEWLGWSLVRKPKGGSDQTDHMVE